MSKLYYNQLKEYLLNSIDLSGYDIEKYYQVQDKNNLTDNEKIMIVFDIFKSEKESKEKNYNQMYKDFEYWLSGLCSSLKVEFETYKQFEQLKSYNIDTVADLNFMIDEGCLHTYYYDLMTSTFFEMVERVATGRQI